MFCFVLTSPPLMLCVYLQTFEAALFWKKKNYLITVRLQNAEGFPPDNSQRHSLEQEITLALILKSHSKSAAQIYKKLDRRFLHGTGRLDSNWLEDEASAQLGVLGDFPDFSGVGDGSSGERGSYYVRRCKRVDTRSVSDETAAT